MVRVLTVTVQEYKLNHNFKIIYAFHSTPYGKCLLGIRNTDKTIVHLTFVDNSNEDALDELQKNWLFTEIIQDTDDETSEIMHSVFSPCASLDDILSVLLKGTEFQLQVWEALIRIPKATMVTYEQLALMIGKPKSSRAVGNAVMKNNIALLIPCHRVVGKSGKNKYKWGVKRKEQIMTEECKYP